MIKGFSVGDYRSIGEPQTIAPLGKINLFVGPNNAGKSNILRFLNENTKSLFDGAMGADAPFKSRPNIAREQPTTGALWIDAPLKQFQAAFKTTSPPLLNLLERIHSAFTKDNALWLHSLWLDQDLIAAAKKWISQGDWYELWSGVTGQRGGGIDGWIGDLLRRTRALVPSTPHVYQIPIDRRADALSETSADADPSTILGGKGIIRKLAAFQNPKHETFEVDRGRFEAIENFLRTVVDDADAKLSVPHEQNEILVRLKGQKYLPLASLGSGIEQVVLHAVAATSVAESVVTFEEPELHLHPVLQRQLLAYLATTSNQYFISTHSAHLIDALHSDVFHVRLVQGETVIEKATTDAHRHQVCADLGYRASDLVQSNCIVWVEGPSDRIYIRFWLSQVDSHLEEHVHYSVMFYGGKLLSHLSAGETDAVEDGLADLIELRLINRHIAVVIDSDKTQASDEIRHTKARVRDEIAQSGGLVWITEGREVENYIVKPTLAAAVEAVAAGRGGDVKDGQFDKALPSARSGSNDSVDKVKTARKVVETPTDFSVLDLKERIAELAQFIRKANGLK